MTKVHNVVNVLNLEQSKSSGFIIRNSDIDNRNTDIEKKENISRQEKRMKLFENILFNRPIGIQPMNHIVYIILGVIVPVVSSMCYTLITVHNLFETPTYWYEFPLQILGAVILNWAGMVVFKCSFYMDVIYIRDKKHVLFMFCVGVLLLMGSTGSKILTSRSL